MTKSISQKKNMLVQRSYSMQPSYKHGQGNVRAQTSDELLKKTVENKFWIYMLINVLLQGFLIQKNTLFAII
jgi:hypothetical protein